MLSFSQNLPSFLRQSTLKLALCNEITKIIIFQDSIPNNRVNFHLIKKNETQIYFYYQYQLLQKISSLYVEKWLQNRAPKLKKLVLRYGSLKFFFAFKFLYNGYFCFEYLQILTQYSPTYSNNVVIISLIYKNIYSCQECFTNVTPYYECHKY